MARPTMERAIEALERGDSDRAARLCEEMKHESQFMHDLLVDGIAGLISFVKERLGDEGVEEAWRWSLERSWRRPVETIAESDRREVAKSLAATWRAHSTSGVGPKPGAFEIAEDDEKLTFTMNPCGSGQRLWRLGRYGEDGWGVTDEAHDWSYGREGFPLYCTHCAFMNEALPDPLDRISGVPVRPARRLRPRSLHLVLVQGPGRHPGPALRPLRVGAVGWGLRARRPTPSARRSRRTRREATPARLELSDVPGGASRETFLVEAQAGTVGPAARSARRAVVRPAGGGVRGRPRRLVAAGVAVPSAAARSSPRAGASGRAGYLMDHVDGTSVAPRVLRRDRYAAARGRLPASLRLGARPHPLESSSRIWRASTAGADPALAACELWEGELDRIGEPLPAVEVGLRWLRLNRPPPVERPALVHGDFRLGNLIVDEQGLAAVIDWELCHGGDPAEDVGWLCIRSWRFGNDDRPVAGLGALEDLLDAYEDAGGRRPDPDRLRWWEAMGNVKWAVICARQAHDHLTGRRRSHELASLGRRICEPEWDLLRRLLPGGGSRAR